MFNPIPSIFGTEYDDGFKENRSMIFEDNKRHVEFVNALGYVPFIADVASAYLGRDVVEEVEGFITKKFF